MRLQPDLRDCTEHGAGYRLLRGISPVDWFFLGLALGLAGSHLSTTHHLNPARGTTIPGIPCHAGCPGFASQRPRRRLALKERET